MTSRLRTGVAGAVLAAFAMGACNAARDDGPYDDEAGQHEEEGQTGLYEEGSASGWYSDTVGTSGSYDSDIDRLLAEHYRDNEMFEDDTFDFDVSNGVVTITGEVDNPVERDALVNWRNGFTRCGVLTTSRYSSRPRFWPFGGRGSPFRGDTASAGRAHERYSQRRA